MKSVLLVFVGAGLGGVTRHGVNLASVRWFGAVFPWGTLVVNVAGSLAMGLFASWLMARAGALWSQDMRLLLMTGVLGGFTTFSAFSLDAWLLWERGAFFHAGAYVLASVVLSIAALGAGLGFGRALS
ncbi:MAG: fluoride efflux transporter CrcB [Bosea sp. (in: a-proteobacteria)]